MAKKTACDLSLPSRSGERRIFTVNSFYTPGLEDRYQVKKLKNGEYFLARFLGEGVAPVRSRFGNAEQIREDLQHLCENGALPDTRDKGWA